MAGQSNLFKRIKYFIGILLLITAFGIGGFMLIEGWGFMDAFYMTIITISTVGFGEVQELSTSGRLFTSILIITSFSTFAFAISSVTAYVLGGEYAKDLRTYKKLQIMKAITNHVIICGYGRVGKQVASDLLQNGESLVIIELDEKEHGEERDGLYYLNADSTNDESLELAGISHAKAVITCLPKDADNLYVVLAARERNPKIKIICRATQRGALSKLRLAGANHVIMPDTIGGSHMASLIRNQDVVEFMDAIKIKEAGGGVNLVSIPYERLSPSFRNKTIGQLRETNDTGVAIIGFKSPSGDYHINPSDDFEVELNTSIFVLGTTEQIKKLDESFEG